jgi:hypothetical protein
VTPRYVEVECAPARIHREAMDAYRRARERRSAWALGIAMAVIGGVGFAAWMWPW